MNIKDQVCSLELAKKLKELGIQQERNFYWVNPELTEGNVTQLLTDNDRFINHHPDLYFSAFTVSELFELLPILGGYPIQLLKGCTLKEGIIYCCRCELIDIDNYIFVDKNPVNSCGKMLIFLLENKYLEK